MRELWLCVCVLVYAWKKRGGGGGRGWREREKRGIKGRQWSNIERLLIEKTTF